MTTTLDRPPLENALGIPGARSVSLLDPDGPAVLWWAGDAAPGTDDRARFYGPVWSAADLGQIVAQARWASSRRKIAPLQALSG